MDKNLTRILGCFVFIVISAGVHAQVAGLPYELKKPQKYENRRLKSEKTGEKKFTIPRKFMSSTVTHYNYFFNANEKIKEVLARAKAGHRDDYTQLLSFYNYSLDETSRFKGDLDSVIYKSTAGILLHDLRNSWIDNLYLLIGRAYYLRNTLDSAHITFQYVNYAFAPKEDDGYDKVIGSNSNEGALTISTKEKRNIAKKLLSRPPSRNEALVWQVKTYLALEQLPEAASLIQTLQQDPQFPSRLKPDLVETQAWYFYKKQMYDSAAVYLERALDNAENIQERARWEYLIAQLYERSDKRAAAAEFYARAQKKTIDPIMEVYALLNSIRQEQGSEDKSVQSAIRELVKMARRDKYVDYRDIIYYTAATMETDRKNMDSAKLFLTRSIKYSTNNPAQKSKSFLALADIAFAQKDFADARRWYDSVDVSTIDPDAMQAFTVRKQTLTVIARQLEITARQDSLQRLASLPLAEREAYVKKLARQLRRQQGLKDEDVSFGNNGASINGNNNAPTDLFNTNAGSDWYFANESLKSKGFSDFKSRWGNRPNVDNWQRSAVVQQQAAAIRALNDQNNGNAPAMTTEAPSMSYEGLMKNIPVAPEKLKISNDSVMNAQFTLGKSLQDGLEDYYSAIDVYEKLLQRFPASPVEEQTLFNLYYCYKQTGNQPKMADIKKQMDTRFANGKLATKLGNPDAMADSAHKKSGERLYNDIYNLFIEGKFDEALAKKHDADSLFGNHYWSPQLLYIEAVYHIQERDDSVATSVLNHIVTLYPATPMAARAKKLVEVLSRRREIEDYLTNLKVERPAEDSAATAIVAPAQPQPREQVGTPLKQDSATVGKVKPTVSPIQQPKTDTAKAAIVKPAAPVPTSFTFVPEQQHLVALVMDKVDPVYVNEAKNAFARYHKEKFSDKTLDITPLTLTDDTRFMLIGKFDNAAAALDYIDKTRKLAATDIIPWMPAAKYSFIVVTESNLEVLKNNKDLSQYKKFLGQHFPAYFKP